MSRLSPLLFFLPTLLLAQNPEIPLTQGLQITQSCRIVKNSYALSGHALPAAAPYAANPGGAVLITGDNIEVDFQNAEMNGATPGMLPDKFAGTAIYLKGNNITLKNARIKGYKVALLAIDCENLRLENCDLSYNYRPRLRSMREREDFSDWLSYHHNENDEWLRYGAAVYLKNCNKATVKGCRASGVQNALLMTGCNGALVYNNTFTFNSGLGIGMYRSSRNRIMHNRLDWNVRGYSHGFYERGQDSAGILLYEQSSNNLIAFNSATHSGDGLFLWAGQSTMDTGEGGCNDNYIFGNDFSHAPTNGVEVTFSRNRIQGNIIRECTYGIWGGYSYQTQIIGNFLAECKTGIAIEHGQFDTIQRNLIQDDTVGISLWARETQPSDWGYAQKRDTRSHDALIDHNVFYHTRKPLKISNSENVAVNGSNLFFDFEQVLETPKPNRDFKFWRNDIYAPQTQIDAMWAAPNLSAFKGLNFSYGDVKPGDPYEPLNIPYNQLREPDSLPDGMPAALPSNFPRGRRFIIVDEWGPYDFRRPIVNIDTISGNTYSLVLIGPSGDWKIARMSGVRNLSARKGTVPATLTVERDPSAAAVWIEFEYSSPQSIRSVFGELYPPGKVYKFDFQRFEQKFDWHFKYFSYTDQPDFEQAKPLLEQQAAQCAYAWWGSPGAGVPEDKFATLAETAFQIEAGEYRIELTSDDGVRLYLDGKLIIDNWDVHEPETDEVTLRLGGKHRLRIEHFDAGGFATLDFRMTALHR